MFHRTEDLAGMECGCLSSGDSKRAERIQRQGLGYVRAGGGHVGTCGGRLGEEELVLSPTALSGNFMSVTTSLYASVFSPGKGVRVC